MPRRYDWARERAFRIDEDGCLIWRGSQHSNGTPQMYFPDADRGERGKRGRTVLVRRAILALMLGRPLLISERVIATCGKDLCCKCLKAVSHSTIGHRAMARHDWTKDHARRLKISATRRRRWTDDQVADMRARRAAGDSPKSIADAYGTTTGHLCHILNYRTHVLHLPDAVRYAMAQQRDSRN
jgi:hypothetical protein